MSHAHVHDGARYSRQGAALEAWPNRDSIPREPRYRLFHSVNAAVARVHQSTVSALAMHRRLLRLGVSPVIHHAATPATPIAGIAAGAEPTLVWLHRRVTKALVTATAATKEPLVVNERWVTRNLNQLFSATLPDFHSQRLICFGGSGLVVVGSHGGKLSRCVHFENSPRTEAARS